MKVSDYDVVVARRLLSLLIRTQDDVSDPVYHALMNKLDERCA